MAAQFAFAYSLLRFTEAYGLWKQRTWAEWVAFVSGTLLLPLEIRGLMRGINLFRSALFLGNLSDRVLHAVSAARRTPAPARVPADRVRKP